MRKPKKVTKILEKVKDGISKYREEFLIGMVEINDVSYEEILRFSRSIICKEVFVQKVKVIAKAYEILKRRIIQETC